jgi:16S rRNA (uracil1498-N3)-methyltransferase
MNLLLFRPEQRQGTIITATPAQSSHINTVLKADKGDRIRVGELHGLMGEALLLNPREKLSQLEIRHLDRQPPPKLPLTLLLALPRPKVLRRIIQAVASLGVSRIVLLNAYRVEKSYWQTPWLQTTVLEENLCLGLEQAGDTQLPEVLIRKRFKPFVEDELPAMMQDAQGWLAHPGLMTTPLPDDSGNPLGRPAKALLAIGPEGGFIPYEVDKCLDAGLQGISLGPRILKVDTAVAALIGKLFY